MVRHSLLLGLVLGLAASPAAAQDVAADIVAQLVRQGFDTVVQERTLLGRVQIIASRGDGQREIIVNPNTGEILRDLWLPLPGGPATVALVGAQPGKADADDDAEDEEEDDEEEDDEENDEEDDDGPRDDDDDDDDDDDER